MSADVVWDDELWDRVWERSLDHVERHNIAMAVLRRRLPARRFDAVIAVELARRWRRHSLVLASLYGLWSLFWGGLGWDMVRTTGAADADVPLWCAAAGLLAVVGCLAFRRMLRPLLLRQAAPAVQPRQI